MHPPPPHAVARILTHVTGAEVSPGDMRTALVSKHTDRMVQRIGVGDAHYFVKAFDPAREEARTACAREVFAMTSLRDTGLAPRLVAFDRADAFIITEEVPGQMLETVLTADTLAARAFQIGEWSARYIVHQPRRDTDIDWFDYLRQYSGIVTPATQAEANQQFSGRPTPQFALAKHDQSPKNFILTPTHTLIGLDFERSRFKPMGWDVIAAAAALLKRFPERENDILAPLCAGWDSARQGDTPEIAQDILAFFARQASHIDWARAPYK